MRREKGEGRGLEDEGSLKKFKRQRKWLCENGENRSDRGRGIYRAAEIAISRAPPLFPRKIIGLIRSDVAARRQSDDGVVDF